MPSPRVPAAGSAPAAASSGAVEVKPTALMSAARIADGEVDAPPGSSSGLVAVSANGAISEYHPPAATPRPSTVSGASVWSGVKVTAGLVSSLNGRGAACTGTRSSGPSVGVRTSRPEMDVTYSRAAPTLGYPSTCVGSMSRCRVAGSAVRVTVTCAVLPGRTVTRLGLAVIVAPPAVVAPSNDVVYVRDREPVFWIVTVFSSTTVVAPTGTMPKVTDTRSGASVAKARTWALVASKASTRPEPTRSGPKIGPVWPSPLYTSWVAVFITAALICGGVQSGCSCATRAVMPATCGDDMDVPE